MDTPEVSMKNLDIEVLSQISLRYFKQQRRAHSSWTITELFEYENLPKLELLLNIARQAGFSESGFVTDHGYGGGTYGNCSYGSTRRVSNGTQPVPRRITILGQFSYRGYQYSLGKQYRDEFALILDQGKFLNVTIPRRLSRSIISRHFQK